MPKKQEHPQHYHDRPWTLARCNLLIRRLSQNIDLVRKTYDKQTTCYVPTTYKTSHGHAKQKATSKRKAADTDETDPIWAIRTSAKKRRTKHARYARSSLPSYYSHLSSSHIGNSGEGIKLEGSQDVSARPGSGFVTEQSTTINRMHAQSVAVGELASALDAIFDQTSSSGPLHDGRNGEPATNRGSSSLLDMCLRKIPDTIRLEEKLRKEEDPDDKSDVVSELMQMLLEHPFLEYSNGSQLAEVTRARAIDLLQEVFAAGLLDGANLTLTRLNLPFVAHNRLRELEIVTQACDDRYRSQSVALLPQWDSSTPHPKLFCTFWDLAKRNCLLGELNLKDMGNSYFRQFRLEYSVGLKLFLNDHGRTHVLTNAVKGLTNENAPEEISHFSLHILQHALVGHHALDERAHDWHERSVCELLSSLVVAAVSSEHKLPAVWPVHVAAETVHTDLEQRPVLASLLILAANLLLDIAGIYTSENRAKQTLNHFCGLIKLASDKELSMAAQLLCSATQELDATNTSEQRPGFTLFKQTLETLISWRGQSGPETARSRFAIRRMVLTAALANATTSPSNPEAQVFAKDIEKRITALKRSSDGPAVAEISPDKPATHRWEEGMCEWVAITPAPPPRSKGAAHLRLSQDFVDTFKSRPEPGTLRHAIDSISQSTSPDRNSVSGLFSPAASASSSSPPEKDHVTDTNTPEASPLTNTIISKPPASASAEEQPRRHPQPQKLQPSRSSSSLQFDGTNDDFDALPSPSRFKGSSRTGSRSASAQGG